MFAIPNPIGGAENTRRSYRIDNVSAEIFDGLTTTTDKCAEDIDHVPGTPCATKKMLKPVAAFASSRKFGDGEKGILPTAATPEAEAVRNAAYILGCRSESCVIAHPVLREFIVKRKIADPQDIKTELDLRFKASGPRDSLALLSNYNLDETLQRWGRVFTEFFPCPFAMMDFDTNGDYFGEADLPAILDGRVDANLGPSVGKVRRKFTCFGCIVNTDNSTGPGKHWVAVFVDCRSEPWTVEYFNSAGRPPPRPMMKWMERTRSQLSDYRQKKGKVISVPVTDMDHQESQTECGLYSLFYIRRRLEGIPYTFFEQQLVPDAAMTKFRQHVFASYR